MLGDVHDGWRVARTMLAFERQALGGMGSGGGGKGGFAALAAEAKRRGVSARPELRDHLVQLRIRQMVLRHLTGLPAGQGVGRLTARRHRCSSWPWRSWCRSPRWSRSMSPACTPPPGLATDPEGGRWSDQLLSSQSASIGGGTNEIVRNVIAERALGLPRDEEGTSCRATCYGH